MNMSAIVKPKKCIGCGDLHDEAGDFCSDPCWRDYLLAPPQPPSEYRRLSGLTAHCRQHNKRQCPKCFGVGQ